MDEELRSVRVLLPLLRQSRFGVVTFVALGLLGSAFEGLGLYLFIPLLHLLGDGAGDLSGLPGWMQAAVEPIPVAYRIPGVAAAIVASIALKNALIYANAVLFAITETDAGYRLRQELYEAVLTASPAYLDAQPSGRVANALFSETWRAQRGLVAIFTAVVDVSAILILAAVLIVISWWMTLVMAPILGLVAFLVHRATRRAKRVGNAAVEANAMLAMRGWEGLTGLSTVRAFGQERFEAERFGRASAMVRDLMLRLYWINSATTPLFEMLLATLLAGWLVALSYTSVTLPTLAAFLMVLYRLQPRVRSLVGARVSLMELGPAAREIEELTSGCEASRLPSGERDIGVFRDRIVLRDVSVTYPGNERPSLRDLDLEIAKGSTVAIVGRSGAGKSTLIQVLCRTLDPTAGTVTVDGISMPDLDLRLWRARIAIVAQDVHLFSDTVRNNIAYGNPTASDEDVCEAARLANADDFIRALPNGYDTEVGERGTRLSGGQRQRIAFARALVRKPEILVLDEATNALDSHAETLIQDALSVVGHRSTVVVIAHRLATVRNADEILVLEDGRLVERGGMASLLARDGPFRAMYRLQMAGVRPDPEAPQPPRLIGNGATRP